MLPFTVWLSRGYLLKLVGYALHVCGKRTLILRCDAAQLPRLYREVIDRRMKPIGKLVDIFGDVSTPYAAVRCYGACGVPAGEKVYTK
jgi:RNA-binding protein